MMPDYTSDLESALLDSQRAFRRIATVLGLERTIPCTSFGWDELATEIEKRVAVFASNTTSDLTAIEEDGTCWCGKDYSGIPFCSDECADAYLKEQHTQANNVVEAKR